MPIHLAGWADTPAHESASLFQDVLDSNPDPVLVVGSGLELLHANQAAGRLFGAWPRAAKPVNLAEFCGPDRTYFCELVALTIHGNGALEGRDISIGEDVFHLSVHRGTGAWIVSLRAVTRELSREYRLKQLERHSGVLIRAMNGIEGSVIIVDHAGTIRFMNAFTRRHIGDLLQGVDISEWPSVAGFFCEDGVTPLSGSRRIFPRALQGQTVIDEPMVIRNQLTGRSIRLRASATPVLSPKGKVIAAIGWFHEVPDNPA
ncbi:hypothetical protein Plav_2950 [Parvibaculum lavamentivorans DS-1]|uniref:PAS domain-containing protein n=1 Tax=Parvibaculum lavamentivorans (strain DS-1 / DSM 13023 / NCIMB 13966) TaxID=402881 RepID=A7HXC4_PARL1|nr:PAS domain-containing protein [Parvibaculum lavamentivorans]ABS64557.1 hypothetical protein Plav_2950 [Parvibaculum lavamentivorans DS-1]